MAKEQKIMVQEDFREGAADTGNTEKISVKKEFRPGWIVVGLIASILAATLYMGLYGVFRNSALSHAPENPIETQDMADILVEQSYMFYYELCKAQSEELLSFLQVYVEPKEGCEWVLDKNPADRYFNQSEFEPDEDAEPDTQEYPEMEDTPNKELDAPNAHNSEIVYSYLKYLEEVYFAGLEERFFNQISYNFDYRCADPITGAGFSNTDENGSVPQGKYFYLTLEFDANGNCEVKDVMLGQDASLMRKYVTAAARKIGLEYNDMYQSYNEEMINGIGLDSYFTLRRPKNCSITYSISNADWQKYEQGEASIYLNGQYHNIGIESSYGYLSGGFAQVAAALVILLIGLAFFFSPRVKLLRLPAEVFVAVVLLGLSFGESMCNGIVLATLNGNAAKLLAKQLSVSPASTRIRILVYGLNFLLLALLFFFAWYIGVNLRGVRSLGMGRYIRERSLIYRVFPYLRSRVEKLRDAMEHVDLTKDSNKMIVHIVVINGLVLCLICSLWIGDWVVAALYSVFLYWFLRRYVSNLQKKYAALLRATNEIAEGNLNVQIQEDLGVFEPFKPQIYRIQKGFKRAVEDEVKSQRMKAELITNVSHDLKTPLTAIITYVNLLKEENITKEQQKEYLDTLERKSLRLKVLIEDLFEVSKANSQTVSLNIMDVDIMNLVRQVAFEMGDKLAERKLDLRMAFPDEKVVLPLDSQRTYRIYENLFGNIAKYAMPGTRVYVNGFCVEDTVVVTMKNITAEEISVKPEELTERFVRGDAARNTEGSGLGLAIAKSFTELQGGTLELDLDGDLFKVTTVWKH